jgi:hypothetical protein
MSLNFNAVTPAAPVGSSNIQWQNDSAGNVSAYVGVTPGKQTVAPSAGVLTIDLSLGSKILVNVNAAITSIVFNNPTDGQVITIVWQQDSTGHAIALPSDLLGATAPSTGANLVSGQQFMYNQPDTNFYAVGVGVVGM